MRLLCIGLSHKTADVALRERLAFDQAAVQRALPGLAERWKEAEFAILSTCNRTEVYVARPAGGPPNAQELTAWLGEFHHLSPAVFEQAIYALGDAAAVRHLFATASGLDSLVLGEAQIAGQVKDAYAAARQLGTAGPILNDLFQTALHAAKRVRTETDIAVGHVSVASAAVDCMTASIGSPAGKCVLNVGAGKMNDLMLRRLAQLGVGSILVANRSPERAAALARQCGGQAVEFDRLAEHLAAADAVLTSTASRTPIFTREMVAGAMAARNGRPLLFVDIAVPRDVDPAVGELDGVSLYNIDDLDRIVAGSFSDRHRNRVAAEAIVAHHVARLLREMKIRDVAPTIDSLLRRLTDIADEELAAAVNKLSGHEDAEQDVEILRRALHRTIRRILHPVARNLRRTAGSDTSGADAAALRKLFGLDEK